MPDKKPSLIVSLLSKKGKEPGDKEPMPGDSDDSETGDEGMQLASSVLDAIKSEDPQALYDAMCGLIDSHMDKGEPMSPGMSPESAPDESSY